MIKNNNSTKAEINDDEVGCSAITFKQQRDILNSIDDERYRNFFYFCCCTGMRVCEALSIKTKDIDKKNKVIKITMPDTATKKHKREVPYLPELLKGVDLTGKYLFENITEDGSRQYFYNLYKNLGLNLSRHSTRHTFVSVCVYVGIDPCIVQQWVGHTDLKMTNNTYTHNLRKGASPILSYITKLKNHPKAK